MSKTNPNKKLFMKISIGITTWMLVYPKKYRFEALGSTLWWNRMYKILDIEGLDPRYKYIGQWK
jgi:hypothetical protein